MTLFFILFDNPAGKHCIVSLLSKLALAVPGVTSRERCFQNTASTLWKESRFQCVHAIWTPFVRLKPGSPTFLWLILTSLAMTDADEHPPSAFTYCILEDWSVEERCQRLLDKEYWACGSNTSVYRNISAGYVDIGFIFLPFLRHWRIYRWMTFNSDL